MKYYRNVWRFSQLERNNNHFHNRRIGMDDICKVADTNTNTYICGSKSFNNDFKSLLQENGYKKIYMDEWKYNLR